MRLIKSNIPTDRKNSFFIKVLSGILVFCLLLVSFVFLLIYQNVKKRSLEQSYLAEQDIVSNVSYSASIMQDTASSMLTQLNGDPKLLQLIYSMDTESLSVIQSMQLLQTYTRASSWLDSVYIYCAEEDCICYAYANGNTYQLSFGTLDDFFDAAFVRNLAAVSRVTQKPAMRQLRYRSTSSDKTVFSYVLPVRTSLNRYNGFFVANISAERLMQLGYGMANGTERQLLIVDANGQTYTSGMTLLEQEQTDAVIEAVLGGAAESGQMVVQEANAICTWSRSADTDLYFISCISDSAISSQLRALTRWFLLFYLGIVVFAVLISVYLTIRINREYAALQTQYTLSEKRYAENYSYIKHAILRSFFTLRSSDFVIGRQFSDNGIELEQYSGFALFLLQLRQRELSDDNQNMSYRRMRRLLLSAKEVITSDALIFFTQKRRKRRRYGMNSYNIGLEDRKIIEEMYNAGAKPCEIAARIGKCQATIYREIKRGEVPELNARCRPAYRAEVAEKRVTEAYRKRGRRKATE